MRLAVFFLHKVHVVGGDDLDPQFAGQFEDDLVHLLLVLVHRAVCSRLVGAVALHFQVIIVAPDALEPADGLLGLLHASCHDFLRYLAAEASR